MRTEIFYVKYSFHEQFNLRDDMLQIEFPFIIDFRATCDALVLSLSLPKTVICCYVCQLDGEGKELRRSGRYWIDGSLFQEHYRAEVQICDRFGSYREALPDDTVIESRRRED